MKQIFTGYVRAMIEANEVSSNLEQAFQDISGSNSIMDILPICITDIMQAMFIELFNEEWLEWVDWYLYEDVHTVCPRQGETITIETVEQLYDYVSKHYPVS